MFHSTNLDFNGIQLSQYAREYLTILFILYSPLYTLQYTIIVQPKIKLISTWGRGLLQARSRIEATLFRKHWKFFLEVVQWTMSTGWQSR